MISTLTCCRPREGCGLHHRCQQIQRPLLRAGRCRPREGCGLHLELSDMKDSCLSVAVPVRGVGCIL